MNHYRFFGEKGISKFECGFKLCQQQHSENLYPISPGNFTPEEFAHLRRQISCVAASTRHDVAYLNTKLLQFVPSIANSSDATLLNAAIKTIKKHPWGLLFPKLNRSKIGAEGYADASFATNESHSSQLGMMILLCDHQNNAVIIYYESWKWKRVTRSILAPEFYRLTACFDYCITILVVYWIK